MAREYLTMQPQDHLQLVQPDQARVSIFKEMASHVNKGTSLDLSCTGTTSDQLQYIAELFPNIQSLNLFGCINVTNDAVKNLATLKSLRSLDISKCWYLTDDGLKYLSALTN